MSWNMYRIFYEKEDGTLWNTTHYCDGVDNALKWFHEQYPDCEFKNVRIDRYI